MVLKTRTNIIRNLLKLLNLLIHGKQKQQQNTQLDRKQFQTHTHTQHIMLFQ